MAGTTPIPVFLAFRMAALFAAILAASPPARAIQFPDTAALKKTWTVAERKDGRPVGFFRKAHGDSLALRLEWGKSGISSLRLDQPDEIQADSFTSLTDAYGNGAAWHETMSAIDPKVVKVYPGLQQEWNLKGFGGERGWLGSGIERGRYFLVFRADPPIAQPPAEGPLRLGPGIFAYLDSSSQWLHVDCKEMPGSKPGITIPDAAKTKAQAAAAKPKCFSPGDDPRWLVRIDSRSPVSLHAWLDEGASPSLSEIKRAVGKIPDASQHEYAKDLAQMLLGEAQLFLVKFAQRLPAAFTWPSWQIQDFRGGAVPYAEYLPLVRRQRDAGDFLPAFRSEDPGLRLAVNLYYRGTVHLTAEGKP